QLQLRVPPDQFGGQFVGLPGRGAVADGDQLDVVLDGQLAQRGQRGLPLLLWLVRVDRGGVDQLAGPVDDGDLDTGAVTRVQADGRAGARGRGQQQVTQVRREHAHG